MQNCKVYTSLFDLGRESIDGRTLETYKIWLIKTISLFPGIVVFHDGVLDDFENPQCILRKIDKNQLIFFSYLGRLETLLATYKPLASDDITFQLPEYSLVQYSKFDFALQVKEEFEVPSVLWVDAGISRFIHKADLLAIDNSSKILCEANYSMMLEFDLRNNIDLWNFEISDSPIGSCHRVFSGGSFWINSNCVEEILHEVNQTCTKWLEMQIWDNEQILLRSILPNKRFRIRYVSQLFSATGGVVRKMSMKRMFHHALFDTLISWLMTRGTRT